MQHREEKTNRKEVSGKSLRAKTTFKVKSENVGGGGGRERQTDR